MSITNLWVPCNITSRAIGKKRRVPLKGEEQGLEDVMRKDTSGCVLVWGGTLQDRADNIIPLQLSRHQQCM